MLEPGLGSIVVKPTGKNESAAIFLTNQIHHAKRPGIGFRPLFYRAHNRIDDMQVGQVVIAELFRDATEGFSRSLSLMSLAAPMGESRTPTRSVPQISMTAVTTSINSLARFSIGPPY